MAKKKRAKSHTVRSPRAEPRVSNTKSREQRAVQDELFDLRHANITMLHSIVFLLTGEEAEQRRAIATIVDLVSADAMLADRMIRILDENPRMKEMSGDLYERAWRVARPGRSLA
ncbi:MAG: hypothetical protein ACYC9L_06800 [Sulfuricaulis sp.]